MFLFAMQADSTIETPRLTLRPYRDADFEAAYALRLDRRVFFWQGDVPPDPATFRSQLKETQRLAKERGIGHRAIFSKRDHFIGQAALWPASFANEIEIGYQLCFDAWGHGYATEAVAALIDHGLHTLGLPRIVAVVLPTNTRSLRVIEKLGLVPQGEVLHAGLTHRYFVLERDDYLRLRR